MRNIKKRNKKRENEIIVLFQIFIFIIGFLAIAYSLGSEIKFVSAKTPTKKITTSNIPPDTSVGKYDPNSIVDYLRSKGQPYDYNSRKILAQEYGIENYRGTAAQNKELLSNLKGNELPPDAGGELTRQSAEEYLKQQKLSTETSPPADTVDGLWPGMGHGFLGHLAEGAMWGLMVAGGIYFILPILGADEGLAEALAISTFGGILAGKAAIGIVDQWISSDWLIEKGLLGLSKGTLLGWGVGIGVGVALFYKFYEQVDTKVVAFTCLPWQAPTGGSKCEECNKQGLPCSEYQCRSLGQACELINQGTDNEQCVWVNSNDINYPTIQPWDGALELNEDYEDYEYKWLEGAAEIAPPDRGVKVEYTVAAEPHCIKAFTPLSFGVTLNEPAMCKIDTERKQNFDDMAFYFSGGLSLYNHSYTLSLPGLAALNSENITIQNNGEYELSVKCQDANGNSNTADFVFKFCVEKGPDTTPPLIVTTNIPSGSPIAYDQTSVDVDVYVNEPSDCKWSHLDQDYENMENDMDCSSSVFEMNAQMLYTCTTTLTGLKNREENKFYFRCIDNNDNTNRESYEFSLIGTQPLVIDWAKPDDITIKDATESIKVTLEARTSAGYNEGESNCYYSETGETEDYIMFFNTNSYQHSQDLWLGEGDYTYYIKCIDLGGNYDVEMISFTVESDDSPPIVVRAYHEETYLKLVTNEPARCVYDTTYTNYPCDYLFDDGIEMKAIDDINHYTEWNTELTLYVKCEDAFGSQPAPDECSIIVRPSNIY